MFLYVSHSMARLCSHSMTRLKLEKIKILCYNIFNSIRIEILKYQEQDKEAEQNRQIIKTKNSRREVTANETQ